MESPISPGPLTVEDVAFYALNGYLVLDQIVLDTDCDALLALAEAKADKDFSAIMNIDRTVPEFRKLLTDRGIVRILRTLQGKEVCALMSQVLFKKAASAYAPQAWNPHQDNSYSRTRPGTYITINIFFADSDPENGGLYAYAGSHREGLMPFEPTLSYHEKPGTNPGNWIKSDKLALYPKVDLCIKKGSMIVLSGETVHGSYQNNSTRSRPLFSGSYVNYGEPFWPGSRERSDKQVIILT